VFYSLHLGCEFCCRDIRTYGFRKLCCKEAREAGVAFIQYASRQGPVVSGTGGLKASISNPDFSEPLEIETDLVILSTGVRPDVEDNWYVSNMLQVLPRHAGQICESRLGDMAMSPLGFS